MVFVLFAGTTRYDASVTQDANDLAGPPRQHQSNERAPTVGRTPAPRVDRREQILTAAQDLLTEGGLGAATVRAVASRAGIGASTMRYWFPTQEQLSAAVAQRALAATFRDERINDASVAPAVRLTECMAQFLPRPGQPAAVQDQQMHAWLVLITSAVGPGANAMGRALYASALAVSRTSVEGWLRRLADEGALVHHDIARSALSLLTRIDGLVMGLALPDSTLDLETAHRILRDDVEALITTRT